MQNVQFRDIDDFLEFLPEEQRLIVDSLRDNVFQCLPEVKEKLSYNVPYYSRHYRLFFIWPAAVTWGNVALEGVQFGFCYGNELTDTGFLDKGNRKQVYSKTFFDTKEIDYDQLNSLIYESYELDLRRYRQKKKSSK